MHVLLQAFDGGLESKWLDFGGANGGMTWLEYRLLPTQPTVPVIRYSLTAAEDEPSRDPRDFVLEGSTECPAAAGRSNDGGCHGAVCTRFVRKYKFSQKYELKPRRRESFRLIVEVGLSCVCQQWPGVTSFPGKCMHAM